LAGILSNYVYVPLVAIEMLERQTHRRPPSFSPTPIAFSIFLPHCGRPVGDGHDRTPVAPQNAAFPTYKAPRVRNTARRRAKQGSRRFRMNRPYRWLVAVVYTSVSVVSMLANVDPALAQEPTAVAAPWLARARVAGSEVHAEMSDSEIMQNLSIFADQKVSVIEADSDLSRLLTDKQFEAEIALMRRYCGMAHQLGIKVVWYYPTLEVLSPNVTRGMPSMAGTHWTWVQRGLDGTPNVFIGSQEPDAGDRRVHWVAEGTE